MPDTPTMRVRFRTYCYGCRRFGGIGADRWHQAFGGGHHRWDWEYWIHCGGVRLVQRQSFATFDRAWESARRSYIKLADTACLARGATA